MNPAPTTRRGQVFRYEGFTTDGETGLLTCHYSLDGHEFTERVTLAPGPRWSTGRAQAAARLVYLLAGVSYYKTSAPPVIDLGGAPLTGEEGAFLREYYVQGLGEFAHHNNLDLSGVVFGGNDPSQTPPARGGASRPRTPPAGARRALVPFGGGIDSIVTVEQVRHRADVALFVVNRPRDRYAAIEAPAAVTGLPACGDDQSRPRITVRDRQLVLVN